MPSPNKEGNQFINITYNSADRNQLSPAQSHAFFDKGLIKQLSKELVRPLNLGSSKKIEVYEEMQGQGEQSQADNFSSIDSRGSLRRQNNIGRNGKTLFADKSCQMHSRAVFIGKSSIASSMVQQDHSPANRAKQAH